MILDAEHGFHFAKEGDRWRCVEHLGLVMLQRSVLSCIR